MIKSFQEYLNELFSSSLPFTKPSGASSSLLSYYFTMPDNSEVETTFEFHKNVVFPDWEKPFVPGWYLEFSRNNEFKITGQRRCFYYLFYGNQHNKRFYENPSTK